MKTKISYISEWVGKPPTYFSQCVEVWFSNKELFEFKKKCNLYLDKSYCFYEIETFLKQNELNIIANILDLRKESKFKPKANTIIIYHKDHERQD